MPHRHNVQAVICAAGYGFSPQRLKVMEPLGGKILLQWALDATHKVVTPVPIVVLNPLSKEPVEHKLDGTVRIVIQEERTGTADAVRMCLPLISPEVEHVLCLYGDMPLWREETLDLLVREHLRHRAALSLVSVNLAKVPDPESALQRYGRLARDCNGKILGCYEPGDPGIPSDDVATVNPSLFVFKRSMLSWVLEQGLPLTKKTEESLQSTIAIIAACGRVHEVDLDDPNEALGVNNLHELEIARQILADRLCA